MMKTIEREEARTLLEQGAQLVDVLPSQVYNGKHLPEAINIPLTKLDRQSVVELRPDEPVIVYCHNHE